MGIKKRQLKKLTVVLFSIIFTALTMGSIQYVFADHLLLGGQGIFKNEDLANGASTKDSKYQVHVQAIVKNAQGQLVSISEADRGIFIPHQITDLTFDHKFGETKIVTINDVKYEKAEIIVTLDTKELMGNPSRTSHVVGLWIIHLCGESEFFAEHGYRCLPVFQANTNQVSITIDDIVTAHWTILREMN